MDEYAYLSSLSISLIAWLTGLIVFWNFRSIILLSSLLAAPLGFLSLLLVPTYWDPGFMTDTRMGFEDLLFCFFAGGMVWFPIIFFKQSRIIVNLKARSIIKKFALINLIGIALTTILFFAGLKNIGNPFITMLVVLISILSFKKDYIRFVFFGFLGYLPIYFSLVQIALVFWPDLHILWKFEGQLGNNLMGYPAIEWLWALAFGATWSAVTAFIFNAEIEK